MCACEPGFVCSRCAGTPGEWRYHSFPDDAKPFPKSRQFARGQRRYRRKVTSPKQWQAIIAAKQGPCRVCVAPAANGSLEPRYVQMHHLVSRQDGGDDEPDNIVPLCQSCHARVTVRSQTAGRALLSSLTDAEYAYMVERGGEGYPERAYGIEYSR